jgi:tetratricopeptide (TPR) repeat protein
LLTEGAITAEPELRRAAQLDPTAPEPWQTLAEAQTELGATSAAIANYKRALDRDPSNTAALERLSQDAFNRRDNKLALEYLARLKTHDLFAFDPALPNITDLRLGHVLTAMGYPAAGAQSYIAACDLPPRFNHQTEYLSELTSLYRQRPLLLTRAGDSYLRLNQFDEAQHAYALADAIPSTDDLHQVLTRRLYTTMKIGYSASAAEALFERLDARNNLVDDALLSLFRHVSHHSNAQPLIASALTERLARSTAADQRLQSAHLALARALCLPAERTPAALRDTLREHPAHTQALRALFAASATDAERISDAIALVGAHPENTPLYMDELLGAHPVSVYLDQFPADESNAAAALLRASLLLDAAEPSLALDSLVPLTEAHAEIHFQAAVLRASIDRLLARPDRIDGRLADLPPLGTSAQSDLARARIHMLLGRMARASAALSPHLVQLDSLPSQFLTTAAFIFESRGESEAARALYKHAILNDPIDDAPYRRLLALLRPTGAAPDPQGHTDTYRELRSHIPWSAAVAFERAVSDLQGGQRERAEQTLGRLVLDSPRENHALELLADLMYQRAEYEPLVELLDIQIARSPMRSGPLVRKAQVLSARGQSEDAAELLALRLAALPGDGVVSRALEQILRGSLDRGEEADELAFARLERIAISPANRLELFELYVEHGRDTDAQETLAAYLRLDETRDQVVPLRLLELLRHLTLHGDDSGIDELPLLDILIANRPDASEAAYALRLDALVARAASTERIIEATADAMRVHPKLSPGLYDSVGINLLIRAGRAFVNEDEETGVAYALRAVDVGSHALSAQEQPLPNTMAVVLRAGGLLTSVSEQRERALDLIGAMFRLAEEHGNTDAMALAFASVLGEQTSDQQIGAFYDYFANVLSGSAHDEMCEPLFRSAIRFDPTNLMALNNLGYRLIEQGEDLDEAHSLLARSYDLMRLDPDIASEAVIDSLGWVRYKLGMIKDGGDDEGVLVRGAVTLLGKALQLSRERAREQARQQRLGDADAPDRANLANITVVIVASHYGDALWVDGQRERALEIWRESYEKASALLDTIQEDTVPGATLDEVEAARGSCGEKMLAVADDREPLVESIAYDLRPAAEPSGARVGGRDTKIEQDKDAF